MTIKTGTLLREDLRQLLTKYALEVRSVTLASGKQSDYYIDGKRVAMHPLGTSLIGRLLLDGLRGLDVDAVGGLETGSIPLTTAILYAGVEEGIRLNGFWVRKEAKKHGMMRDIEGLLEPGMRVVIVDDVVTTGGSILRAVEKVRAENCVVVKTLAIVDREEGAHERLSAAGIPFEAIFTTTDLLLDSHHATSE